MAYTTRYTYRLKNVSPLFLASIKEITPKIIYSKNGNKYSRLSRYAPYRTIINGNKKKYYETQNNTQIEESQNDRYLTVSSSMDRLDKIALAYYNDPAYWWIIAKANNIIDPFDLKIGTLLRIPNINAVYASKGVVTNA